MSTNIVDVLNGMVTCPDCGAGPFAVAYQGDQPPAQLTITHHDDGTHTTALPGESPPPAAAPVEATVEAPAAPAEEPPTEE